MPQAGAIARYEDLEPQLKSGDLVLFHGVSRRSRMIEELSHSEFSHVAMIVRGEAGAPPRLWQSDPRPVSEDVEAEDAHGGAQLNDLRAALARMTSPQYGDTPFVRALEMPRDDAFEQQVADAIAAMEEKPFPSGIGMLRDWILGRLHVRTSDRHMYCAEVIAATYQAVGLLPRKPPANSYLPRDFSDRNPRLRLLRGARLGPCIALRS